MKLKSLNNYIGFLILLLLTSSLKAEEKIDIWNKENKDAKKVIEPKKEEINNTLNSEVFKNKKDNKIEIENELKEEVNAVKIFGIYDPEDNNFNLNMWSNTEAEQIRSSFKRINKIKLSNTSSKLFENAILSFAYPPNGMSNDEFIDLRVKWMIDNKKTKLIENFLKQNKPFPNKKKLIQYLVDGNIAKANIKEGCLKISFWTKV